MTLKEQIISCFQKQGADLVGFGSIDRFRDTFLCDMMPSARTVICAAFRVLRGAHRGIEDGTTYYQYTTMGIETMEENVMPLAMLRVCGVIEDAGYAALPQRRAQTVMTDETGTNPEILYKQIYHSRKTEPELDFTETAIACGLGEKGLHGSLLTKEFGPFVRLCAIVTDAAIEPDPIAVPSLCDGCQKCLKACPGNALSQDGSRDAWQCAAYYNGANASKNPFLPDDAFWEDPARLSILAGEAKLSPEHARAILDQLIFYGPVKHGYAASICGHACLTACYVHLEEKGLLRKSFENPFRNREEWTLKRGETK